MILFPLGNMQKSQIIDYLSSVKELKSFSTQKESTEICFVENTYTDFLKQHIKNVDLEGDVLDINNNIVGKHKGYMHYTIGKRRGFSVNGAHEPHYVIDIIPSENQIIVGKKEQLKCNYVVLDNINMFIDETSFDATVKLRYRTKAVKCHVEIKHNKAFVTLKEYVMGVALAQAGVFYDNDKLLGGGWIIQKSYTD
jgi:tRNA-specific 2-thiouridylase